MAERAVCDAGVRELTLPKEAATVSIEQQILDFVYGRTDGAALLDALYGDTLDELLPSRLTDLLSGWRAA
jgi:hypothetical protein